MTHRRKPKCGLAGSAAEHAAEFQSARHEALEAIDDAQKAMSKQKCLIAGKRIDDGYVAIGKMQASAQTGHEMAETSRVHSALEKADEPFESSCVRDTPIAPGMARKDGASALFRQSARLAGVDPVAALIAASIPMGVPGVPFMGLGAVPNYLELEHPVTAWFQPFGGPDIPMGGRMMFKRIEPTVHRFNDELRFHFTAEWNGDLTIEARVLAERWRHDLARGNVLGFVYTVSRQWLGGGERSVHENGILSELHESDRQRLMVWLDGLAEQGLAGLGAPYKEPKIDIPETELPEERNFEELLQRVRRPENVAKDAARAEAYAAFMAQRGATRVAPAPVEEEKARVFVPKSAPSEPITPAPSETVAPTPAEDAAERWMPALRPAGNKAAVAAARAHAEAEEAAERGRPRNPRPASDDLDKYKRSIVGPHTGAKLNFMVTSKNDDPLLVARRVREFPEVLIRQRGNAEPMMWKLVTADEDSGFLEYRQTTAAELMRERTEQAEAPKKAPKRVVKVTPAVRKGLPAAETPQVDPFVAQPAPPQAFGPPLPAELPAAKALEPSPTKPEYKEGTLPLPQRRAGPEPIAPSELEPFFYAANAGAGFAERLYRIPRVKADATPLERLHQQQVSVALMPTSVTHEGQLFVRGQLFTLANGETVISYRANTDTAFVPHFPTEAQRKENDQLIIDLLTRDRAPKTRPAFDKPWTGDPRTILQLNPAGIRIRTKGAMEFWPTPTTRFDLAHKPRAENADLTFTSGRGYDVKVPMKVLREAVVQPNGLEFEVKFSGRPFIITLPTTQAAELQAWLGKSANEGLGGLGAELPDQFEVAAEDFSYFELGTHTAVFDTPIRATFSVGGPNHIVFIDVAARDSRTQLHRRGAFKVLGTFEPEFRQRGTARGLSEQRYSDPAHLSFQLTPTALARLQVWLDAQEERGALFGLGSANYVSESYHPVFFSYGVDFDAEHTFISPSSTYPTQWPALNTVTFTAVRSPQGGFLPYLTIVLGFDRHELVRDRRMTRFESQPNVQVDDLLTLPRARNERAWAFTDWQTNQTVTVKLTDKAYAAFQVWLDQALSEPL